MQHTQIVTQILNTYLSSSSNHFPLAFESYDMFVSELDEGLLPPNYYEILSDEIVRVYYYSIGSIIIYVITSVSDDKPLITGLLNNNKLQKYIIN